MPFNAEVCPYCGRLFSGVKCPICGFEEKPALFTEGCPQCGYMSVNLKDLEQGKGVKEKLSGKHSGNNGKPASKFNKKHPFISPVLFKAALLILGFLLIFFIFLLFKV